MAIRITSELWLLIAVENMAYAMLELHGGSAASVGLALDTATGRAGLFYVATRDLNIVVVSTEQSRHPARYTPQLIEEPSGNLKLAIWGLQMC
ncbi:hypothetical protein BPAE_0108g00350 [Botrytis paeoniae]|uniref:Uncharacterized protein n=1 Tax=Botrytis paeoniae TaxID=278948 RepID=A0A4Z1FN78_9HELO|nr:hypothetical protein BPAE_0108g00350 [Botrytis paeoniae]